MSHISHTIHQGDICNIKNHSHATYISHAHSPTPDFVLTNCFSELDWGWEQLLQLECWGLGCLQMLLNEASERYCSGLHSQSSRHNADMENSLSWHCPVVQASAQGNTFWHLQAFNPAELTPAEFALHSESLQQRKGWNCLFCISQTSVVNHLSHHRNRRINLPRVWYMLIKVRS